MNRRKPLAPFAIVLLAAASFLAISGCKSYWIDATVQNQSAQTIDEVEVSYPSASFGVNALQPGAQYHYRFQVRNSGPVAIDYHLPSGQLIHAQGPSLQQDQGAILIQLLPNGKVTFTPTLKTAH